MAMNFGTNFPRQTLPYKSKGTKWRQDCVEATPKYLVYIHVNKQNGHCYVGITHHVDNPNRRWNRGLGYHHSPVFFRAIVKYGWDNFDHITEIVDSKALAYERERELIKYYKGLGISYNVAEGGDGLEAMTEETKEKLRGYTPWIKGRHHTKETRERIAEAGRGRKMPEHVKHILQEVNRNREYGPVSEEHRQKARELFSKPVLQLDKKTGEVIAEYACCADAEKKYSKTGRVCGHISEVCLGRKKRRTCYGYKWRFRDL